MATLLCCADGNLSSSSTWAAVDSTSFSNSESTTGTPPTSAGASARSSTFTPGAITIDGIAIKLGSRAASPSGTITVNLFNSTGSANVAGTSVTINVSDLPTCSTGNAEGGWIFFKFSSPVTLIAATAYAVQIVTSVASQVTVWAASGTNWSRALRTTTTQAPTTGDDMIICGEWTAAATVSAHTVTMDSTAATNYGNATTTPVTPALAICQDGTLTFGSTASTNYILQLSGQMIVYNGGTFNMGTSGTPIPASSTATLQFNNSTDGGMGARWRNGSTVSTFGVPRTSGKNVIACKFNADAAANATSLTVDTDTGWLSGDAIAIAPTSRTSGSENGTLSGNATSAGLAITGFAGTGGGLAAAHSGTSPTQGEIVLLTRNVTIKSVSSSNFAFIFIGNTATVTMKWMQTQFVGSGSLPVVDINTTSGTVIIDFCSFRGAKTGITIENVTITGSVSITNSINYAGSLNGITSNSTSSAQTISGNYNIGNFTGFSIVTTSMVFTNNVSAGNSQVGFNISVSTSAADVVGTFSGNVAHSNGTGGFVLGGFIQGTLSNNTAWRNGSNGGVDITSTQITGLILDAWTTFGNNTQNYLDNTTGNVPVKFKMKNCTSNGDSSFSTTTGFSLKGGFKLYDIEMENCNFSSASGILTACTNDIVIANAGMFGSLIARNCAFGASTFVSGTANLDALSKAHISSQNHKQTSGNYLTVMANGQMARDTTISNVASPSQRLTPVSSSAKLETAPRFRGAQVACASGDTATVSAYVRKSVVGDGVAYNGNQPRLILRNNPEMGISGDTVLATASAAAGTWEQLSATTPSAGADGVFELIVDCDGTAGWINVDDWAAA